MRELIPPPVSQNTGGGRYFAGPWTPWRPRQVTVKSSNRQVVREVDVEFIVRLEVELAVQGVHEVGVSPAADI